MSITKDMAQALKDEAKKRKLATIQETMRSMIGEYFMLEERLKDKKEKPRYVPKLEARNPLAH
jgi:hypothetical protein